MTPYEQKLLEEYLTHLNILGKEGTDPNFDAWYQEVRYAQGPNTPQMLQEVDGHLQTPHLGPALK